MYLSTPLFSYQPPASNDALRTTIDHTNTLNRPLCTRPNNHDTIGQYLFDHAYVGLSYPRAQLASYTIFTTTLCELFFNGLTFSFPLHPQQKDLIFHGLFCLGNHDSPYYFEIDAPPSWGKTICFQILSILIPDFLHTCRQQDYAGSNYPIQPGLMRYQELVDRIQHAHVQTDPAYQRAQGLLPKQACNLVSMREDDLQKHLHAKTHHKTYPAASIHLSAHALYSDHDRCLRPPFVQDILAKSVSSLRTHHALIIDTLTDAYRFSREKQYEFIQELTIDSTHKRWLSHSYIYQLFCYLQDIRARTGLKNDHPVIFALTRLSSVWHYIVCYISKFEWSYKNTYTLQTVEDGLGMALTFNVNNHEIQQSHACPAHQYAQTFSTRPSASATIITPHAYVMHTASHIPNLVSAPASNEALSQTLPPQSSSPDSNRTPANPATHSNHQPLPNYNAVSFSIFGRNTVLFLDPASIWRGAQASASHAAQASASNSQQLNHHAKASKKRLPPPQPSPPSHKGFRTNPYADYDITKHLNFWQPSQDVDINTPPFAQR